MSALGRYLQAEDVLLGLRAANKRQLFHAIALHVQRFGGLTADSVLAALRQRESAGSTALGLGVAFPHARVGGLDHIRALYVRPIPGLAFDALDAQPVSDVLAFLVPAPAPRTHVELLAHAALLFSDQKFRAALHIRRSALEIKSLFDEWPSWGSDMRQCHS
jgi:PTS system nitrogen regulatory IIA component